MNKIYKIYKWKEYMWTLFDEKRKHGDSYNQNPWYPSFYPLLKKYPKKSTLIIEFSNSVINNDFNFKYLSGDNRYSIYLLNNNKFFITNKELLEIFNEIPKSFSMKINNINDFNENDFTISYKDRQSNKIFTLTYNNNNSFFIFYNPKNIFAYEYILSINNKNLSLFEFKDEPTVEKIIYMFNLYLKNNTKKIIKLIFN